MVESQSDDILKDANSKDVAFPRRRRPILRNHSHRPCTTMPTTHTIYTDAHAAECEHPYGCRRNRVVAVQLRPDSQHGVLHRQLEAELLLRPDSGEFYLGFHTLVLLDIKVKEPNLGGAGERKVVYEQPRFMAVAQCASQMLEVEEDRQGGICGKDALAVGVARLGSDDQQIVAGTLEELSEADLGKATA